MKIKVKLHFLFDSVDTCMNISKVAMDWSLMQKRIEWRMKRRGVATSEQEHHLITADQRHYLCVAAPPLPADQHNCRPYSRACGYRGTEGHFIPIPLIPVVC